MNFERIANLARDWNHHPEWISRAWDAKCRVEEYSTPWTDEQEQILASRVQGISERFVKFERMAENRRLAHRLALF